MKIIDGINRLRAASRREDAFAQRLPLGEERQEKKERDFHASERTAIDDAIKLANQDFKFLIPRSQY